MCKLVTGLLVFLFLIGCGVIGDPKQSVEEYTDTACNIQPIDPSDISTWRELGTIVNARHTALTEIKPPEELQYYHDARIVSLQLISDFVAEQDQDDDANLFSLMIITASPLFQLQKAEFQKLPLHLQEQLVEGGCQSEDDVDTEAVEASSAEDSTSPVATPKTESPTARTKLGDAISVDAAKLTRIFGEPELRGEIRLTFELVARHTSFEDRICGGGEMTAQGVYLVVHYLVENESNARIQPATQINKSFALMDDRARQWKEGGSGDECFLEANFANLVGAEGPEHWIGPGFTGRTVIVFDVPQTATGLHLVSKKLGMEITLEE